MSEWLEQNLTLAYPFVDQVTGPITGVFADAQVVSTVNGDLTLSIFDPQGLTNAHVQIKSGATVVLETTVATVSTFDAYTVLRGSDAARGSSFVFILSTAAVAIFPYQPTPVDFVPSVLNVTSGSVAHVNGLTGDVIVSLPSYVVLSISGSLVTIDAQNAADRVDCSGTDCAKVFSILSQTPDSFGSLGIANDGCHRLVPHPENPHTLLLYNFCTPCLSCDDVDTLNAHIVAQGDYYHQLSAIYHSQFNRYQDAVAAANAQVFGVEGRADAVLAAGLFNISGRSFNRPYFSQLALGITNSSTYTVSVAITVAISNAAVASQLTFVPGSGSIERYLKSGDQFGQFSGFPGTLTVTMNPEESLALSSEVHRSLIINAAATGAWDLSAVVTFTGGPSPLPDPITITKSFPIQLFGAPPTVDP